MHVEEEEERSLMQNRTNNERLEIVVAEASQKSVSRLFYVARRGGGEGNS